MKKVIYLILYNLLVKNQDYMNKVEIIFGRMNIFQKICYVHI